MRKTWLIQSSDLKRTPDQVKSLTEGLDASGTKWIDFGTIKGAPEITNWESFIAEDYVFPYCSTKILKILTEGKIDPKDIFVGSNSDDADYLYNLFKHGMYYDIKKFDMSYYCSDPILSHKLLNGACHITPLGDLIDVQWPERTFIKPGKDLKLFTGFVIEAGSTIRQHLDNHKVIGGYEPHFDELIISSKPKDIFAEWRFFVVNGKVVAGSQYREGNKMKIDGYTPQDILDEAMRWSQVYTPATCFVMDLALTEYHEIEIIEYNCINCSGLYESNVASLASALNRNL